MRLRDGPSGPAAPSRRRARAGGRLALALGSALAAACGEGATDGAHPDGRGAESQAGAATREHPAGVHIPPTAQPELTRMLREGRDAPRHPGDGGGRAWLRDVPAGERLAVPAASPASFALVFEVGPEGVATGGSIQLQVSPFWDWSTPQVEAPDAPGFTTVSASASDVELEVRTLDRQLLGIEVTGRPLRAGDRLEIVYGAGPAKARTDRYAERGSPLWFAVDADGDGTRAFLRESPTVDVLPRGPAQLQITLPSTRPPPDTTGTINHLFFQRGWSVAWPTTTVPTVRLSTSCAC